MVRCEYRKNGIPIEHIWFINEEERHKINVHGLCYYHAVTGNFKGTVKKKMNSLITDLSMDEEELFEQIGKNNRYKIRRAQREGAECKLFSSEEMRKSPDLLNEFEKVYNKMYEDKQMSVLYNRKQVEGYMDIDAMYFTVGYYENKPCVFHSYVYDEVSRNARLYYSCSTFRSQKDMANMIARINMLLHWHDLCEFKKRGIITYDWGGISCPENPNGIDRFKLEFGGKIVSYWNVMTASNFIGNMVLKIGNAMGLFG